MTTNRAIHRPYGTRNSALALLAMADTLRRLRLVVGFQPFVEFGFRFAETHDVDRFRLEIEPDFVAHPGFPGRMDHPFVAGFLVADDLVVHAAEQLGVHFHHQSPASHPPDFQFFQSDNTFHRLLPFKSPPRSTHSNCFPANSTRQSRIMRPGTMLDSPMNSATKRLIGSS